MYKLYKLDGQLIKEYSAIPYNFTGYVIHRETGVERWFKDGLRHRLDGPALKHVNGPESWYVDNNLHRIGGPAVYNNNSDKPHNQYYIDGKITSKIKHDLLYDIMRLKGLL